jgi:hypothetical protein
MRPQRTQRKVRGASIDATGSVSIGRASNAIAIGCAVGMVRGAEFVEQLDHSTGT